MFGDFAGCFGLRRSGVLHVQLHRIGKAQHWQLVSKLKDGVCLVYVRMLHR